MNNIFSFQLRKLRQRKKLSQEALARKMGVTRQTISKWETGDAEPSIERLLTLTQLLGTNLSYLTTGNSSTDKILLEINNLSMNFDQQVLSNVNLAVHNQERIALLGKNGAGKSTLINLIIGLLTPTSGTVNLNFDPHTELAVMPQENYLFDDLTVEEQLQLAAAVKKINFPQHIEELLNSFQLIDQKHKLIAKLSWGQKRKVSLLLALLGNAELRIFDEPTVGMDLESIDLFWSYLEHVTSSVIVITHDFNQIDEFFTRVILLKDGNVIKEANVAKIHSNNQNIETWYRNQNGGQL